MKTKGNLSRRKFNAAALTTVGVCTVLPRYVLGGAKFVPPSEKVNIGIVGCGGQGRVNARALFSQDQAQIISVADPCDDADYSRFYYKGRAGRLPVKGEIEKHYGRKNQSFKCNDYVDFREMLEKEKELDAVLCATPDHVHAYVSIVAMKMGKHMYCEKPLTHNIYEARTVAKVAKETGVATQMGNQGRSGDGHRLYCEWIWDGAIGKITEAHAWSNAGGWIKGRGRPKDTPPVPKGLNWDLWLGPKPSRPYSPQYAPYNWRGWWEFGTGAVGDMMIHNIDPLIGAVDPGHPDTVECLKTDFVDDEVIAKHNIIEWKYKEKGLTVTWHDGKYKPKKPEVVGKRRLGSNGVMLIGEKGVIVGGGWSGSPRIYPDAKFAEYRKSLKGRKLEKTMRRSRGHHRDWVLACKGGPKTKSNFEYGAKLTEFVLLADVAIRAKKKIEWDSENMKAKNAPEAQIFIQEKYRDGFDLAKL